MRQQSYKPWCNDSSTGARHTSAEVQMSKNVNYSLCWLRRNIVCWSRTREMFWTWCRVSIKNRSLCTNKAYHKERCLLVCELPVWKKLRSSFLPGACGDETSGRGGEEETREVLFFQTSLSKADRGADFISNKTKSDLLFLGKECLMISVFWYILRSISNLWVLVGLECLDSSFHWRPSLHNLSNQPK